MKSVPLQGGYCLKSFAEGVALTLKCLLGDPCPDVGPLRAPLETYAYLLPSFLSYSTLGNNLMDAKHNESIDENTFI